MQIKSILVFLTLLTKTQLQPVSLAVADGMIFSPLLIHNIILPAEKLRKLDPVASSHPADRKGRSRRNQELLVYS
jgi:hypothetical protein